MKKKIFLLICIIMKLPAQNICVIDKHTNTPVPFARISIYNTDKKLIFQKTTDEKGCITLPDEVIQHDHIFAQVYAFNYHLKDETISFTQSSVYFVALQKLSQFLDEIVVTGEPIPMEKQQSVFVVKTISEQKIQSMGAQNLKDVLLNENNVQLSNDPILGTGINLLGLSGQAVKILIDGVPMIGRLNGNIDLSQINLNNIQKIEIIEGPMAVKYGTDAMGGVINIITKKNKDKKFSDKFLSYYESNGTYNINNTTLFQYNKHHFNITLGRNFFDGWRPDEKPFSFEKIKVADTLRNKLWKPREQYYATINDDIVFQKLTLGLYADGFYEIITDRGKPFAPYYETAIDNIYRTMRNTQRSTLKGFLINDYYLDAVAARTDYLRIKNAYYKDLTTLDQQLTTNSGDQDTSRYTMYMSRSSISKKILLNHTAEMGYDMYHEKARSSIIKNKAAEQTDIAGFFSYSATIKNNFTIKPAIRFSYNSLYHTPLIPSIHLLYNFSNVSLQDSLAESKHSSLRFSYAKGFRTPSLKELFLNFVDINHNIIGNSHLKPEVSDFWNLNYHLQYRKNKFSYTLEGTAFYNDVRNVITLGMINAVQYSYINVDRIQTTGANIGNTFVYRQLSISSKVSFIGKKFNINANSAFYCYPEIICNIQYLYKKWNTGFNVFSKYTGKMPYVKINSDNASSLTYMKDYYWMDMNIYKNLWKDKLQITLGIKNLFNLTILNASASNGAHSSSQTLLGTGRTYFIQLILNI